MSSSQQGQVGTNQTSAGPNSSYYITNPVSNDINLNNKSLIGVHDITLNSSSLDNELIISASGALPLSTGSMIFKCNNSKAQQYAIFGATCGTGGGLNDSILQIFSYNNSLNPVAEVLSITPQTSAVSTSSMLYRGAIQAYKYNLVAGVNQSIGVGTVGAVANTSVTALSIIFVTLPLDVTVVTAGVGFTVTGDAGATFNYLIMN